MHAFSNKLRLLKLPSEIQHKLRNGLLSEGHARAIVSLPKADEQKNVAERIIEKNLIVREAEELVRRIKGEGVSRETLLGTHYETKPSLFLFLQNYTPCYRKLQEK